ncbi:hypothetical protein JCM10207_004905 [Rhodosporidiobolus poonsookiae]
MSRQLFLHHYLPAHLISALVAGVAFSFLFYGDMVEYPISVAGPTTRRRPRMRVTTSKAAIVAFTVVIVLQLVAFRFLAPLTYGTPGLTAEEVGRRRVLSSWTLHYAPKL